MLNFKMISVFLIISVLWLVSSTSRATESCLNLFLAVAPVAPVAGARIPLIEHSDPSIFVWHFFSPQSPGVLTATNVNAVQMLISRLVTKGQVLTKINDKKSLYNIDVDRSSYLEIYANELGSSGNMVGQNAIPIGVTNWKNPQIQAGYIWGFAGRKSEFRISIYGTVVEDGAGTTSDRTIIFRFKKNRTTGKYVLKFLTVSAGKLVNDNHPYMGDPWIFTSAWTWNAEFQPTEIFHNFFDYSGVDWPVHNSYKHKYSIAK